MENDPHRRIQTEPCFEIQNYIAKEEGKLETRSSLDLQMLTHTEENSFSQLGLYFITVFLTSSNLLYSLFFPVLFMLNIGDLATFLNIIFLQMSSFHLSYSKG